MKNQNIKFVVARGYYSSGSIDKNVVQSLTNIKAAGLEADTYLFPCAGKSPIDQSNELINGIPSGLYGRIWIDVETNPSPGCSWKDHTFEQNCQFVT